MKPFHHAPEVTVRLRVVEGAGLAAAPAVAWLVWRIATGHLGGTSGPVAGLRVFGVGAAVSLLGVCVWPLWLRLREARLWRRHRALLQRCPSCGAPGDGTLGCARCSFPAPEGEGWRLEAVDPFAAVFMVGGAVAMFGLAGMFFQGLASAEVTAGSAVLLALGSLMAGLGLASLIGAVEVRRGALHTPARFTWRRSWQRVPAGVYTEAEVVAAPNGPLASGATHVTLPAATALGACAPADATPFERGLAALLHGWNRSADAPLVLQRTVTWRWPSARATSGADGAYRAASPTDDDGVEREEREQWSVDFNANAFSWLLEAMKLPALHVTDGEEAEELLNAEWCVSCAALSRVIAADDALRAAVEALAEGAPLDDPGYAVALAAARSR